MPTSTEELIQYRQLPNGDLFRSRQRADEFKDEMLEAQERQAKFYSGVAGENRCRHCGGTFMSSNVLDEHVREFHRAAAGLEDTRAVELPTGETVPAAIVPELKQKNSLGR